MLATLPPWAVDLVLVALLGVLTLMLHHSALDAWWRWDDPQILKQAARHAPWEYFLLPDAWRELSAVHLTPWLTLSFDADLALFGLNPTGFYVHQLLDVWLAAAALFLLLRLWLPCAWAAAAAVLLLMSPPVMVVSQQLMTRHYIEGLVLALAALYLFAWAVRDRRSGLALWGALLYGCAAASKEVYVPLACLLPVMPMASLPLRLRYASPYVAVAGLYTLWRFHMLGVTVGGYQGVWRPQALLALPQGAAEYLFGPGLGASAMLLALGVGLLALLWYRRGSVVLVIVGLAALLLPLLPVAGSIDPAPDPVNAGRYLLLVVCVASAVAVFSVHEWVQRGGVRSAALAVLPAFALLCLLQTYRLHGDLMPRIKKLEAYGHEILYGHFPAIVWVRLEGFHHYATGMKWLRGHFRDRAGGLTLVSDEIELQKVLQRDDVPVLAFESDCSCVKDVRSDLDRLLSAWRARCRERPLTVSLERTPAGVVRWRMGPYRDGTFYAISGDLFGKLPMPAEGAWRSAALDAFQFYVRFDSPEGWTTYSDLIRVDFAVAPVYGWARAAADARAEQDPA